MSDRIAVRGMRFYGHHGANPGERDVAQPFDVDVEIELDLREAAKTDALHDTLDYAALHRLVGQTVASNRFALLERLADQIARMALNDERVAAVTVSVAKPGLLAGATPSVTLRRTR